MTPITNRVGERRRDYGDQHEDQDFTHCDRCGLECLHAETQTVTVAGDPLDICPLCRDEWHESEHLAAVRRANGEEGARINKAQMQKGAD